MLAARGFQQPDEVHNPFTQRPFFCRTHHPLTNAEEAHVSGPSFPIHLPGNLRADMEESDLNELAWILPTPACSCAQPGPWFICRAAGSDLPWAVNTARALCLKNSWGQRERHHSGIELSDLDHVAEGIPNHTATSFLWMLRGCLILSLTL